ncbi:hypothetical protein EOD39_18489 [Acipenser ruthenus]|uniref:Uncharacterized protein n=1 Tax=Acipenser ruthenus TaxID=7906 RepID=A0A444V0M2_ACIRT|nr:hypothetical protein EOD39_18489 [Acipenser ruthenus]
MEEAPYERPEGGAEPEGSVSTLGAEALLDAQEALEASPEPTTGELAAEGPPPEKQLPRALLPSDRNNAGLEPVVGTEEGAKETPPEAGAGSANDPESAQPTPAEGPERGEEPESAQSIALGRDPLPHEPTTEPGPQPTTEGPQGGEEPESTQDGGALGRDPLPHE